MENNTPTSHRDIPDTAFMASAEGSPPRRMVLGEAQIKALEWLTNGGSITEAAQFAGVARQTVKIAFNLELSRLVEQLSPHPEKFI